MGGADKGLIELNGRPLIKHVLAAIAPQVAAVIVNANRNLDRYAGFGLRWTIEVTLTRRDVMGFRMLLGRQAIRGKMLVDPGASYRAGKPGAWKVDSGSERRDEKSPRAEEAPAGTAPPEGRPQATKKKKKKKLSSAREGRADE